MTIGLDRVDFWMEAFACATSALIAFGSFYAYTRTREARHAAFGFAFLLIALGTVLATIFDWAVDLEVLQIPFRGYIQITYSLDIMLLLSMCATLAGLLTLFIIAENTTNPKTITLLYFIAPLGTWIAHEFYGVYYLISLVVTIFLFQHFWQSHTENPNRNTLFVAMAFGTLALSQALLMFSFEDTTFYLFGHILRGVAFVTLFVTLASIFLSTKPAKTARLARRKATHS